MDNATSPAKWDPLPRLLPIVERDANENFDFLPIHPRDSLARSVLNMCLFTNHPFADGISIDLSTQNSQRCRKIAAHMKTQR